VLVLRLFQHPGFQYSSKEGNILNHRYIWGAVESLAYNPYGAFVGLLALAENVLSKGL